jgi:DNA-binding PadR family transcriptional regulator
MKMKSMEDRINEVLAEMEKDGLIFRYQNEQGDEIIALTEKGKEKSVDLRAIYDRVKVKMDG